MFHFSSWLPDYAWLASHPRNMSIPFKSVTAAFSYFLCPLILISRGATLVTSLFFVPSALKTSNEKFIGFICILLFLTSYLSIPVWVHPESTSALTLRFLPFFVFTLACTFNSFLALLHWLGIIYVFWEFTGEISCIMPTWNLFQNPASCCLLCYLHHLILLKSFTSSLTASLYSPLLCTLLYHIWNTF